MTRSIGTGTAGGGGGGGAVDSVNGKVGVVVLTAADVGADPSGTAAGLVTAHELASPAHDVSQITDALDKTGDTMSGTLAMGAEDITGTGAVTAATFNGVALTTAGAGLIFLADDGTYKATPDSDVVGFQFSDSGNRGPGAALRWGGDRFGNKTPGSARGAPVILAGTIIAVSWSRQVTPAGTVEVTILNGGNVTGLGAANVPAPGGARSGATSVSVPLVSDDELYVGWDVSSSGTTQDLGVTVWVQR